MQQALVEALLVAAGDVAHVDLRAEGRCSPRAVSPEPAAPSASARRVGRRRTAWLAVTGHTLDAATALAWGLVDDVDPGR